MNEKRYGVGEIAALTNLTVRTLQHYDNIGLLPAGRDETGGRRFYTGADIMRLEQIQFYKLLGFSLDEIRARLMNSGSLAEMRELLVKQEFLLVRKIEQLHTSWAAIDASLQVIDTGAPPPFEALLRFIRLLPGDDVFEWAPSLLDRQQQNVLSGLFKDLEEARGFYHTVKRVLIEALVLFYAGVPPAHARAQELAKRWAEVVTTATANSAALEQFERIGNSVELWAPGSQALLEEAYAYLDRANDIAGEKKI